MFAALDRYRIWGSPIIRGTILGVPIIKIINTIFWGLYWGPPIKGNYHMDLGWPGARDGSERRRLPPRGAPVGPWHSAVPRSIAHGRFSNVGGLGTPRLVTCGGRILQGLFFEKLPYGPYNTGVLLVMQYSNAQNYKSPILPGLEKTDSILRA